MSDVEAHLRAATTCLVGVAGLSEGSSTPPPPVLAPMAFWYDGAQLWTSTAATGPEAAGLREVPRCAVYVAPVGSQEVDFKEVAPQEEVATRGVVALGTARVHGAEDPIGLALHGPAIAGAMSALALRRVPAARAFLRELRRRPAEAVPRNRVVLRIAVDDLEWTRKPADAAGVAPALPDLVPADVRRALAGRREVVVAATDPEEGDAQGPPALEAARWSVAQGGIAVDSSLADGVDVPLTVTLHDPASHRRPGVLGVALHGRASQGTLAPERVSWWRGFESDTAVVPAEPAGGIELPD